MSTLLAPSQHHNLKSQWASKQDLVNSLNSQSYSSHISLNWEEKTATHWYDRLALLAKKIKNTEGEILAFASVISIRETTYKTIQAQPLSTITNNDIDPLSKHYMLFNICTNPCYIAYNYSLMLITELTRSIGPNIIALSKTINSTTTLNEFNWQKIHNKPDLYLHPNGANYRTLSCKTK